MFDIDLADNPSTALTVGTNANLTFSLTGGLDGSKGVRSVAAVATSAPHVLTIAHQVRAVKGLRYASTRNVAPDVLIDHHSVSIDKWLPLTTAGIADPQFLVNYGAMLIVRAPRAGADAPTTQLLMDNILRLLVILNPSSNAGLTRLLNGEA
jgi:hypothetical protein